MKDWPIGAILLSAFVTAGKAALVVLAILAMFALMLWPVLLIVTFNLPDWLFVPGIAWGILGFIFVMSVAHELDKRGL